MEIKLEEVKEYKPPTPKEKRVIMHSNLKYFDIQAFVNQRYEEDKNNPNLISHWHSKIWNVDELKVPATKIITVPIEVFSVFYEDAVFQKQDIVRTFIDKQVIPLMGTKSKWFLKNGCFSNKFDFQNCITDEFKIFSDFMQIQYASLILETGGLSEIALREIIDWNSHKVATIYNGMPVRPELRVFYDFDRREVLYSVNYWDYDTVFPKLHDRTDIIVFDKIYKEIKEEIIANIHRIENIVEKTMKNVDLNGKWSIDILVDDMNNLWLIDMALAETSYYWNTIWEHRSKPEICYRGE